MGIIILFSKIQELFKIKSLAKLQCKLYLITLFRHRKIHKRTLLLSSWRFQLLNKYVVRKPYLFCFKQLLQKYISPFTSELKPYHIKRTNQPRTSFFYTHVNSSFTFYLPQTTLLCEKYISVSYQPNKVKVFYIKCTIKS